MQNIEWDKLGFAFMPTRSYIRYHFADGKWDNGTLSGEFNISISIAANVLHYGQAIFEGMKAFRGKDGKVKIFRPQENAKRMADSARRLVMPPFPEDEFVRATQRVIADNIDYVPPYGTGGSLYIRPVMFGTSPQIGVSASEEYDFIIMVMPVGAYYKGGIKPVDAMVERTYDRAAPHGTGTIKAAGNYAASLLPYYVAKKQYHCPVSLFLDPATHTYVDEFTTSNFLAVTKDGKYVTSLSDSILPSVTNKSLMQVAIDLGMPAERRKITLEEVYTFAEIAACGTAVVITPVGRLFDGDKVFDFGLKEIGPQLKKLYDHLTGIQYGEVKDIHNWMVEVPEK